MATVFCLTSGIAGIFYPSLELSRRLRKAGHRVIFCTEAKGRDAVETLGLEYVPLPPNRYEAFLKDDRRRGFLWRWRHRRTRQVQALGSLGVPTGTGKSVVPESLQALGVEDLSATIRRCDPDVLLLDGEMHEHIVVALAHGAPVALMNCFVSIWRHPSVPPPHHLAIPGVGWKGSKAGIALLWWALRLHKWRRALSHRIQRVGCDRLSLLHLLARNHGVDLKGLADASQWLLPFTYRGIPALSLHSQSLEFPHRPHRHVRFVGPLLLEERLDGRVTEAVRRRLRKILDEGRRHGHRLLYAGFGSYFTADRELLRNLLGAVASKPDWQLVLSLGGQEGQDGLGQLPDNVHAFPWVPQLEVLRHANAAVVHGGVNTVDECILHAVPMLIYCGHQTDMAGVASRVVYHRLGILGHPQDQPNQITAHLDRLLDDGEMRSNVQAMRRRFRSAMDDDVAVRAVESLMAQESRTAGPTAAEGAT